MFYTPVICSETISIGAHHCSLDDCSFRGDRVSIVWLYEPKDMILAGRKYPRLKEVVNTTTHCHYRLVDRLMD